MKYFVFCIFIISINAYSQENVGDSIRSNQFLNSNFIRLEDFELYFSLSNIRNNREIIISNSNPNTIGLWTMYALSKSFIEDIPLGEAKSFMLLPLSIKYKENSQFNSIKHVLGIAQAAAVGYMAYRHIKKYGFLK
jgi:hypothetical protein